MIAINMEMPKSCEVCDFRKSDPYSGEVYCSKAIGSDTIIYEKERLKNCPLTEIITCKNCKHCYHMTDAPKVLVCEKHNCQQVSKNFFCADGERRK